MKVFGCSLLKKCFIFFSHSLSCNYWDQKQFVGVGQWVLLLQKITRWYNVGFGKIITTGYLVVANVPWQSKWDLGRPLKKHREMPELGKHPRLLYEQQELHQRWVNAQQGCCHSGPWTPPRVCIPQTKVHTPTQESPDSNLRITFHCIWNPLTMYESTLPRLLHQEYLLVT